MTTPPVRPGRVTIMDIARAADVSRQTVSNVVNRPDRVHEDTRRRVQKEIDRLGYQPSVAAQSLRAQRAGAIGIELNVMGEDSINDVVHPLLVELSIAAPDRRCHLVPFASRGVTPLLDGYRRLLGTHLVDAFILADTHATDPRPAFLAENGMPFVSFGRTWGAPEITTWVDVDGAAGTSVATEHCARQGFTTVAYLGWPDRSDIGRDRRAGWRRAVDRLGLAGCVIEETAEQDMADALAAARRLLDRLGPQAAVVCASDVLALGVLQAAAEAGLTPGRDLGVVGFDDSGLSRMHGLSTVAQPLDQVAGHLLDMVHKLLQTGESPSDGVLLSPALVTRSSSQRLT